MAENGVLKNIGKNIRKYRELRGLTREQLAEIIETDVGYLGQCERGETQLGIAKTVRAIEFFGVSPQEIIETPSKQGIGDNEGHFSEISEMLRSCSANQLALIQKLLTVLIPFIKE